MANKFKSKTRTTLQIVVIGLPLFSCLYGCSPKNEEKAHSYMDSIPSTVQDTIVNLSDSLKCTKEDLEQSSISEDNSADYNCDDPEHTEHPGTCPDDGMYGFDYWDDEDDAYEMDRNQSDPYPVDW